MPGTVAHRPTPLCMGFSQLDYGSGLPFPPLWDFPNPEIKCASPESPVLQADSVLLSHKCRYFFCLSPDNFLLGIYTFFLVQFFHFPAYSYFATKATWCLLDKLQTFQLDIYIECSILYCTCFFPVYSSYKRAFTFSKSGYSISLCLNTFSLPWKVFNLVCLFFRPQLIVSWNFLSVLPDRFKCLSIFSHYVLL